MFVYYLRGHGVEKFELDFDPEHTTPARVFRACLPWRAMVVCPETDRKARRRFLARGTYRIYVVLQIDLTDYFPSDGNFVFKRSLASERF